MTPISDTQPPMGDASLYGGPTERARSAAARLCAAARVLARHLDEVDTSRRAVLLTQIERAEEELHSVLR
jgi:hypothetical protein